MRRGLPAEGAGEVAAAFRRQDRRLGLLEMPTGEQLAQALAKVLQLIADLPGLVATAVTAFLSGGFTTGSMTATGNVAASGNVSAGGNVSASGYVFTPAGYAYNITYTRTSAWLGNDGRIGYASSSRKQKTNIRRAKLDPEAILRMQPVMFQYRAEIAKRDEDPEYIVAEEFGAIAEDLHDLGLGVVVDYDEDGEPRGINYQMVALLAIEAAKYVNQKVAALEARLDAVGL